MDRADVIHSSKIIRSFRTDCPRAVDKIEGVVTLEATERKLVNLIFDEGLATQRFSTARPARRWPS